MINVNTFNLSIYFTDESTLVFRNISRAAVDKYIKFYKENYMNADFFVQERK